jgi:alanine dehydrogenase
MKVGTVMKTKNHEYCVGLIPARFGEPTQHKYSVIVETGCSAEIEFDNNACCQVKANIMATAQIYFETTQMFDKVKEPQPNESEILSRGQILFTYLHLVAEDAQTHILVRLGATCITYKTVADHYGQFHS